MIHRQQVVISLPQFIITPIEELGSTTGRVNVYANAKDYE
jgi:hypothetical protein